MYRLEYLDTASKDLDDIIFYIKNYLFNRTAASNLIESIEQELRNILLFPYANSICTFKGKLYKEYRKAKVKNYYIFYNINEETKTITIVRFIYSKRNIEYLLNV